MKKLLKIVGALLAGLVAVAACGIAWASITTQRLRAQTFQTHSVDFPIPFPVEPAEVSALGLAPDAARQLAQERAIARGKHLVTARYTCIACHGATFGGGVMVDAFPIGRLLGPNLTLGAGSRTADYQPRDWDRIVRHGVLRDGHPAVMPAVDFQRMSDQELSDIVCYIRSLPPVDNTVPRSTFGPLGNILVATGKIQFSASEIASHTPPHLVYPPAASASAEFGKHLTAICMGCHGPDLSGGPIAGGDPSWPPARNLTPDATGLEGWTYDQFVNALTASRRPDGTALRSPMKEVAAYGKSMTDSERQALWAYLQSLPPVSKTVTRP
ncbi:MAG TPA: cytochrome c [Candidatus Eisenbacteria bacterium]|jgi:mono/diheme cytochrome c family protein